MDLTIKEIVGAIDISKDKFNVAIRDVHSFIAEEEFPNDRTGAQECFEL